VFDHVFSNNRGTQKLKFQSVRDKHEKSEVSFLPRGHRVDMARRGPVTHDEKKVKQ
jgi:hypothetical protein